MLAVDAGDETGSLYLAVSDDDVASLEVIDPGTGARTQILLPPITVDGKSLDEVVTDTHSLVVSEARGQVFWIADGAIWSASLPEIPSAE